MIKQTAGREALGEFAPKFAHYNDDILFGENWNDDSIDLKTRCIITVVALMSSGITDNSLKYHLENAKKNGVTKEEMAGIIMHVAFYVGDYFDGYTNAVIEAVEGGVVIRSLEESEKNGAFTHYGYLKGVDYDY